jgi:hypothetical protein
MLPSTFAGSLSSQLRKASSSISLARKWSSLSDECVIMEFPSCKKTLSKSTAGTANIAFARQSLKHQAMLLN